MQRPKIKPPSMKTVRRWEKEMADRSTRIVFNIGFSRNDKGTIYYADLGYHFPMVKAHSLRELLQELAALSPPEP